MNQKLATEIDGIVREAYRIDKLPYEPYEARRVEEDKLFVRIEVLDESVGDGLQEGRHVGFQVADGYAHYVVVKVLKNTVKLIYIPYSDNYHFAGGRVGKDGLVEIFREVVESHLQWHDILHKKKLR